MKRLIFIITIITIYAPSKGQNVDYLVNAGKADAETLLKNYFQPAFLGFGYGLTNAWTNTAKPHQFLGFDITANATLAFVPDKARYFTFNPSNYQNISLANPSKNQLPTVMGPNLVADSIPELVFYKGTKDEVRFTSPTGLGLKEAIGMNAIPAPMIQAGIGVGKETDLKLRTIPTITYQTGNTKVKTGMIGFGVMHDIKQHVPAFAFSPFELSILAAFSRIAVTTTPNVDKPDNVTKLNVKGATIQILASKDFVKVITLFGGVGINGAFTRVRMLGSYTVTSAAAPITDPVDFKFANFSPRATLGVRFNLALVTLSASYTIQKYNTLSAGIGVSVR